MGTNKNSLDKRMKRYEHAYRTYLPSRIPMLIRLDGKAFHTFTIGFEKPFDNILRNAMKRTSEFLCANIQNCKLAYTQSDEISLLINYKEITADPWFEGNIQKIVSISASMATYAFNMYFSQYANEKFGELLEAEVDEEELEKFQKTYMNDKFAIFDSRAFILPKEEVNNYFVWRQQDATRNSVQMVARSFFSHDECKNKNGSELQEMLFQEKDVNWNNYSVSEKRGCCIVKETYEKEIDPKFRSKNNGKNSTIRTRWTVDENIPIFSKEPDYINKYL